MWLQHSPYWIDHPWNSVPGVGTVVAGTLKHGTIKPGANLMLGPDVGDGSFKLTSVKSIHYKRLPVSQARATSSLGLLRKLCAPNHV